MKAPPKALGEGSGADLKTPYYLIDEKKLLRNLNKIKRVRDACGARSVLALKCFSTWAVFDLMSQYMDGTTSSSLYEARLGHERFGKETHAYCVGFSGDEIAEVKRYADKIIFNSTSQLKRFHGLVGDLPIGLRINPGVSHSDFDLADPGRPCSRLGVVDTDAIRQVLPLISGAMVHCNCENDDFTSLASILDHLRQHYGFLLRHCDWISLGGGISFTKDDYPLEQFCTRLRELRDEFQVQIYLEPGQSAVTQSAQLVTTVLDIVRNVIDIAIIDASTEAHMLDLLVYQEQAKVAGVAEDGRYRYMIAGRSCLAGDIFGTYRFASKLRVGQTLRIEDAAAYSMVKKNWFNGLQMPSIVVKRIDGSVDVVRRFTYEDFLGNLS